jgi:predicted nucleic acid-binding protein
LVLDDRQARAAGQLCGLADTADVVDASLAVVARERGARVLTSDPDDLRRLDRRLDVITI